MTVFRIGSATERWPEILPHYRWVYVLEEDGNRKLVEMAARREFGPVSYPVRWWAEQISFPEEPRISFRHVGGITRGMDVQWLFTPTENGVRVVIEHELDLKWPLIGGIAASYVVGPVFIENIAGKTLARVKELAESMASVEAGGES